MGLVYMPFSCVYMDSPEPPLAWLANMACLHGVSGIDIELSTYQNRLYLFGGHYC